MNHSIQNIIQQVKAYDPNADLDIIEKAFQVADTAHRGQKRASGEPYFIHPLQVAAILVQMKLDSSSIAAGLLHDTIEDTPLQLDDLQKDFGPEISMLVDGVTKLSKIKFSSKEEKQAENFRKMILAMASDIRVVLIKLADRLHNMRTLDHLAFPKQVKIATETMGIYAPLANRLGIQWLKIELEDLCLKYLKPDLYQMIYKSTQAQQKKLKSYMNEAQKILEKKLDDCRIPRKIQARLKHVFSIYRKMESQHLSFDQVHDILAFRIIVSDIRQCYEVLGILHSLWKPVPGRFKDYIAMPKVNHYQSLHTTVICHEGHRVEFQIRTRDMHATAEAGIAAHWQYKEDGSIVTGDKEKFQWLRELIDLQRDVKDPAEFLDAIKLDLFATDVYVFTPTGELIELPYGSTPLDFAYHIHTDVGNHCIGAKINDKIVPLDYQLRSGDSVSILTQANSRPKRDWLKFVKSSKAKTKIRQEIKKEQRDQSVHLGKDLLTREVERLGHKANKVLQEEALKKIASEKFGLTSAESLYAQVGYGKLTASNIVAKLFPKEELAPEKDLTKPSLLGEIFKKVRRQNKSGIQVGGHHDILVSLGKCCTPLPGDSITGFITRGRGVMVHRVDCAKALANDPERRVEVTWDRENTLTHRTKLRTVTVDKPGILAEITRKISNLGSNINQASIRSTPDAKAVNIFTLEVQSRQQLEEVIRAVEGVQGVISVSSIRP